MSSAYQRPLHILVVEDNFADYFLLKEEILALDIPVDGFENAASLANAIDYLRFNKPDIVLLDLFLPDCTGIETYNELKSYLNGAAVIVLSGLADKTIALEAIKNGAQDYLTKGEVDKNLLEKTITYALERMKNLERLRIANNRFNLVVKATRDLVWDWDLQTGRIRHDEENAREIYGPQANQEMDIQDLLKLIHPDDTTRIYAMLTELRLTGSDFFEVQYRTMSADGKYRFIYDRGYALRDENGNPVRLIGAAQDITEKIKMERVILETRNRQNRAVAAATIRGQENERKKLGLEIHDNITQILATARLYLDNANCGESNEMLAQSREMIVLATQELRKLSHQLLPPSREFGLKQALEDLTECIRGTGAISFESSWEDFEEELLDEDQQLTIYRIVQEQVNNIIKHARATRVCISLSQIAECGQIELLIRDNGQGFDPAEKRKGVGLRNIVSRTETYGGNVSIQSQPGRGCELKVVFPAIKTHTMIPSIKSRLIV